MNNQNKQTLFIVAVAVSMLFGWSIVSTADVQDAEDEQRYYCEMIELWQADKADNIPPAQRKGWPNYKNARCEK